MLPSSIFAQHRHIGLDLDETLASTVPGLLEYAHREGKLLDIPTIEHITRYSLSEIDPRITQDESSRIWEGYGKLTMDPYLVPLVPSAQEGVNQLNALDKNLSIITARSDRDAWKVDRTKKWVETHFPLIGSENIIFVNHFSSDARPKSHACLEYGVTLMIDDAIENVYDLSQAGISCILLEKPWNKYIEFEHPLVHRVRDWDEILGNLQYYA